MDPGAVDAVADRLRAALVAADVEQFIELLDPLVTWGAPGDSSPSCQRREQVVAWYAAGRRGRVLDVTTNGDKVLVSMSMALAPGENAADRWQVLTVGNERITDIRGYDDEAAARAAAGFPTQHRATGRDESRT